MIIKVTQEHIDNSIRNIPSSCAVAAAISDAFPLCDHAVVGEHHITLHVGKDEVVVSTPESVATFIDAFDDGQAVQPFEFNLEVQHELRNKHN